MTENRWFEAKQLTYGYSKGKWVVIDKHTLAYDPVKKSDRSMWTGGEAEAKHYAEQLNKGEAKLPRVTSKSQAVRFAGERKTRVASSPVAAFQRCECGVRFKSGTEHACR